MADTPEWSPMIGWRKAAVSIAIRLVFALAVASVGHWVLYKFVGWMDVQAGRPIKLVDVIFPFILGGGSGALAGLILSIKLSERTGLIGRALILPAVAPFVLGMCVSHWIISSWVPTWSQISLVTTGASGIAAAAIAGAKLYMES